MQPFLIDLTPNVGFFGEESNNRIRIKSQSQIVMGAAVPRKKLLAISVFHQDGGYRVNRVAQALPAVKEMSLSRGTG